MSMPKLAQQSRRLDHVKLECEKERLVQPYNAQIVDQGPPMGDLINGKKRCQECLMNAVRAVSEVLAGLDCTHWTRVVIHEASETSTLPNRMIASLTPTNHKQYSAR